MNWFLGITGALAVLLAVGWAGLQVRPAPFPPATDGTEALRTTPLPEGLPAPVTRFYRSIYGDEVPVIGSALLSGRARLRIAGVSLPARWRFTHDVGAGYRHHIVVTWFTLPIMTVRERFEGGRGRMELPFGVEEGTAVDQGANLALWAEAVWFPAALVTDARVRWRAVDDVTAVLVVPFGEEEQRLVARFDPESGALSLLEAMRFKGADAERKTLWLDRAEAWGRVNGHPVPRVATVTWLDEGRPWADFRLEEIVLASDRGAFDVPRP